MMKIKDVLTDESKWCQHYYAKDKDGVPVSRLSPEACKFCLSGAMQNCYGVNQFKIINRINEEVDDFMVSWNDAPERTFAEVRALIEKLDI